MKTTILTTAALIGAILFPAIAFSKTVLGCDVQSVPGSNYSTKTDPTCEFTLVGSDGGPVVNPVVLPWTGFGS